MSEQTQPPILPKLLSCLALLCALGAIWYFTQPAVSDDSGVPSVKCNFTTQPCAVETHYGRAELQIIDSDISAFTALRFRFTQAGLAADSVEIDFQGIEMFMGAHKVTLQKRDNGDFEAVKTLPGHSDRSMTWRAVVSSRTQAKTYVEHFVFELQ
ncbi:MAG: hypothetical protein ACPG4U_05110 [Pseudomonadales bacterium]